MARAQCIATPKRRSLSRNKQRPAAWPAPKVDNACISTPATVRDSPSTFGTAQQSAFATSTFTGHRLAAGSTSGLYSALPVGCFDRDLARLCLLGNRNVQSKYAIVVASRDLV